MVNNSATAIVFFASSNCRNGGSFTGRTEQPRPRKTSSAASNAALVAGFGGSSSSHVWDADHEAFDVSGQRGGVVGDRHLGRAWVLRVVTGDDLHQDRHILAGPGQRAGV